MFDFYWILTGERVHLDRPNSNSFSRIARINVGRNRCWDALVDRMGQEFRLKAKEELEKRALIREQALKLVDEFSPVEIRAAALRLGFSVTEVDRLTALIDDECAPPANWRGEQWNDLFEYYLWQTAERSTPYQLGLLAEELRKAKAELKRAEAEAEQKRGEKKKAQGAQKAEAVEERDERDEPGSGGQ